LYFPAWKLGIDVSVFFQFGYWGLMFLCFSNLDIGD
jgi:hypothetical protein